MEAKECIRVLWLAAGLTIVLLGAVSSARGQSTTERYIPLGQSPGLSGKITAIGTISAVDPERRLITLSVEKGTVTASITERTEIWLDRTKLRRANIPGEFADCRVGRSAEVMYEDPGRQLADWVKLQISDP